MDSVYPMQKPVIVKNTELIKEHCNTEKYLTSHKGKETCN